MVAFPKIVDKEIKRISRQSTASFILTVFESAWFSSNPQKVSKMVKIDPKDLTLLKKIQAEKKGLVFITPHMGNWEMINTFPAASGLKMSAIARRVKIPVLNRLFSKSRAAFGSEIIEATGAARGIFRALRNGRAIGILMDQNIKPRKGGIYCDFFGLPVPTTKMPATLLLRTGAQAFICSCLHVKDGLKFQLDQVEVPEGISVSDLTQKLLKLNEVLIKKHPEQWLWNYERWRYMPEDLTEVQKGKLPFYSLR